MPPSPTSPARRTSSRLRDQVQSLRQQQAPLTKRITQLRSNNESLSNQLVRANRSPSLSSERLTEAKELAARINDAIRSQ
jgi:predicted RNase H-like nuclease (RuvC/YqgF family)